MHIILNFENLKNLVVMILLHVVSLAFYFFYYGIMLPQIRESERS